MEKCKFVVESIPFLGYIISYFAPILRHSDVELQFIVEVDNIVSDKGSQFVARFCWKVFCANLSIILNFSIAYHPQS